MVKSVIKKALKRTLEFSAPLFSKKSTLAPEQARQLLFDFSPRPTGCAIAANQILEPVCDLQIVIPAYNMEQYLEQCMQSVLSQETKYTFRVILIDDGSTDRTPAIADSFASDSRVQVIHQENRGFSGARNVGLSQIFAKYLMFVDSDDILHPGAIEALLDAAFRFDCDVVEGGAYYLTDDTRTLMYRYDRAEPVANPAAVFHGQPWAKVYKARLFENLRFPEGFWYEDSILAFLVWPVVQNAYCVPGMAYIHRRNRQGITRTSQGKPKSVDTYWITEQLMAEHAQAGLPVTEAYFRQILDQFCLNQHRVSQLPKKIQESMFVLTCQLMQQYFGQEMAQHASDKIVKALQTRDFGAFRLYCIVYM